LKKVSDQDIDLTILFKAIKIKKSIALYT